MTDKDFKEQNNYREVECCSNCEYYDHFNHMYCNWNISEPIITVPDYVCDKWEHE